MIQMAVIQHLSKPPITEALFDIQFQIINPASEAELEQLADSKMLSGWQKAKIDTFEAEFEMAKEVFKQTQTSAKFEGFLIRDPDMHQVVQFRKDRLSVSHINMYTQWEDLEEQTSSNFGAICPIIKPEAVTRIAARYINKIDFSGSTPNLKEYLIHQPLEFSVFAEMKVDAFRNSFYFNEIKGGYSAIVNIGTIESENKSKQLLVDVDVYKAVNIAPEFTFVNEILGEIRALKNEIFFGLLTDKALESYL